MTPIPQKVMFRLLKKNWAALPHRCLPKGMPSSVSIYENNPLNIKSIYARQPWTMSDTM